MPLSASIRTQIGMLVIATSVVQFANGFFGTYISLRVALEGFDAPGLVLSAYFAGFTLGAFRCASTSSSESATSGLTPHLPAWSPPPLQ